MKSIHSRSGPSMRLDEAPDDSVVIRSTSGNRVRSWLSVGLTVTCVAAWVVLFRPPVLGGTASFVGVEGISMTGTFSNGSLAVVEKKSSYQVGNIIAYRIPAGDPGAGDDIIHRIVGGNGTTGFVTKGDHNSYTDQFWHPKTADVIGRVWFVIPGGANWLAKLRQPVPLALLVAAVSFAFIAWPSKTRKDADGPSDEDADAPVAEPVQGLKEEPVLVGAGGLTLGDSVGEDPYRPESVGGRVLSKTVVAVGLGLDVMKVVGSRRPLRRR